MRNCSFESVAVATAGIRDDIFVSVSHYSFKKVALCST